MVIFRDPWFIRSQGRVKYIRRNIWDFRSQSTVHEPSPGVWDICEHGFAPWTFAASTANPTPNDDFPAYRTRELVPYRPAERGVQGMPQHQPPEVLWAYDKIQFARLIAEAEAVGLFDANGAAQVCDRFNALLNSMGLGPDEVSDLIDRARQFWDTYKGPELRVLAKPLTPAEASGRADDGGRIEGVVAVELAEFVDNDLEGVLDLLGERLIEGGEALEGTAYTVVGQQENTLYLRVSGIASTILDEYDQEQAADDEPVTVGGKPLAVDDRVWWADPDGSCSGWYKVESIDVVNDLVVLNDGNGSEARPDELYRVEYRGPFIMVEFDLTYAGGNYTGVGETIGVPTSLIYLKADEHGLKRDIEEHYTKAVNLAFAAVTGHDPIHIVHFGDEECDAEGNPWEG